MELLKGKTAMVTGGTRGIGYAIVKTYLDNGAAVALCGSRQETVDKALAKLKEENADYKVIGLCPDLGNPQEVEKAVQTVRDTSGSWISWSIMRVFPPETVCMAISRRTLQEPWN